MASQQRSIFYRVIFSADFLHFRRLVLKSATMRTMTMLLASQDTVCRRHAAAVTDSLSKDPQLQERVGSESGALAAITIALGCTDSETIKHCVRAVANLARCAPLQPRMGKVTGMISALTQLLRASDAEVSYACFPDMVVVFEGLNRYSVAPLVPAQI